MLSAAPRASLTVIGGVRFPALWKYTVLRMAHLSINLLASYHEWRPLIGYATDVLFKQ